MLETTIIFINKFILIYFAVLGVGYTVLLVASFPDILRKFNETMYGNIGELVNRHGLIPISIITPAYNEATRGVILNCVYSILNSEYKNVNLIIINDGSTDNTLQLLIDTFALYEVPITVKQKIKTAAIRHYYQSQLYPNLIVLDKEHSNTGDTMNVGINACQTPLFATVDADTVLEPEALTQAIFTFLSNKHCVSTGGAVYVLNGNKAEHGKFISRPKISPDYVPAIQACEYLRSFLFGRSGWNTFGGPLSFAGAFSCFDTQAVISVGGFDLNNYAQDAEIIVKLHQHMRKEKTPYTIRFTPTAFSWTEVPGTLKSFWNQRNHWQRGLLRSFLQHKRMFLNPNYGVVGMYTYPFYLFFEILSPLVECTAYICLILGLFLGLVTANVALLFIALAWGYIAFLTIATAFLQGITFNKYSRWIDAMLILGLTLLEMIGFRQYNIVCKTIGILQYFFNRLRGKGI